MAFLKRAFFSMKHSWLKNLFVIIMFTVLFACCVGFLVVYATSSKQLAIVRENTACSVTLKGPYFRLKGINRAAMVHPQFEDVEVFADDPSVAGCNYYSWSYVDLVDAKPLYAEEAKKVEKEFTHEMDMYLPLDSARDKAFTVYGYNLIAGRHFIADEPDPRVCLISQEFAEFNDLKLGSQFTVQFHPAVGKKGEPVTLSVIGIFKAKESKYLKGYAAREEELIFAPYALDAVLWGKDERDIVGQSATVYLNSIEDVPGFVERTKEKFKIIEVFDSYLSHPVSAPPPEEYAGMAIEELWEELEEHPVYYLLLNQEWYDMTMGPTEKMNQLAGGMTLAFLAASALVLVLVNAMLLKNKRREFGMLCAMGESKAKVALQAVVEMLAPIIIAMLLGLGLGVVAGIPLAENLTSDVYEQNATDLQGANNMVTYNHTQQSFVSFEVLRGDAQDDLLEDALPAVVVPPQPKAQVDGTAVAAYFAAVLVLALVAVLIQAGAVLRLKPAKILTGKP